MVNQITSQDQFKSSIASGVAFVDFFATWCGPCRMVAPVLEKLEPQYPSISFYKLDIEEVPEVSSEFEVSTVPTFILFKEGKVAEIVKGAAPAKIKQVLDQHK